MMPGLRVQLCSVPKQLRTGEFGKQPRRLLRIADGNGTVRPGKIVLSRAGVIGNEFFHDPFA